MIKKISLKNIIVVLLLISGIGFRLINLDGKIYWHDEVFTSLRTTGYTQKEVINQVFTGKVTTRSDLLQYQTLSPETTFQETVNALKTHPEHPPLYYIFVHLWQDWFGSSISTIRSLSVVFSILIFPILYGLCSTLFQSHAVALMSVILMSISPFHVLYAQEAREYSLWTAITLLSYWYFWQAVQKKSGLGWLAYAATTILNLYTSLLSVLAILTQGIYLFLREKRFYSRSIRNYFLVILGSAIAFLPWIVVFIRNYANFQEKTAWAQTETAYSFLIRIWGLHFSSLFLDFGFDIDHPYSYFVPPLILILIGYGGWILIRTTHQSVWLFLLCLLLIPSLSLILPDIIFGGQRSASTRYFIPSLIAAQLIVAYLFTVQLNRKVWQGGLAVIVLCGFLSCWQIAQADVWWNKGISYPNAKTATVINEISQPLIITDAKGTNLGNIISLAYLVKPDTKFKLVTQANQLHNLQQFNTIFLFYLSPELQNYITQQYNAKIIKVSEQGVPLRQVLLE